MNLFAKSLLFGFLSTILCVLLFSLCPAWCDEVSSQRGTNSPGAESTSDPGLWLLFLYRDHISPVDGDRCPSVPSCSSYSAQAFRKHGFFMGWIMTVDRLIHEGKEERAVSSLTFSNGLWKLYDPVENNDFWWSHAGMKRDD